MGDGQSKPAEYDPAQARNVHKKFEDANVSAETAFEEAFQGDEFAQAEIKRIVQQLDGIGSGAAQGKSVPLPKTKEDTKRALKEKAVERAAAKGADKWLQKQIEQANKAAAQRPMAPDDGDPEPPPPPTTLAVPDPKAKGKAQAKSKAKAAPEGVVAPVPELYRILGVGVDATFEEIKKAYRKEALKWHPDKNRDQMEKATKRFQKINDAFDTLYDPEKRNAYDSGQVKTPSKAKKLAGHGWAKADDHEDEALTPAGVKIKKQSWSGYIYFGGRIDDTDPVQSDDDPRAPQERIKVFWRFIGEKGYEARENKGKGWLAEFVAEVWSGTPDRWPQAMELSKMNESSQQEWKERRMVFNRRKSKVLIHVELHEEYLDIPDREEKEKARMRKIWPNSFN